MPVFQDVHACTRLPASSFSWVGLGVWAAAFACRVRVRKDVSARSQQDVMALERSCDLLFWLHVAPHSAMPASCPTHSRVSSGLLRDLALHARRSKPP